jgi:nucleoside-diphosphate-sugar epimerase
VTGAAGRIGSYFAEHAPAHYRLRLMVRPDDDQPEGLHSYGEVVEGDLGDLERLKELCRGIDTVLHLAGDPSPSATWASLLDANIIGAYHAFIAAKAAGCRRVVYASSIHAVSGYPVDVQVKTSDPVNPGDLYGVTKCFGEALGRYMAEQEQLSVIAIRIGSFQPIEAAREEGSIGMLDSFVSQRDLQQLIERCIDAEHVQFAIVNGLSNNRFKRLDISDAREMLGYTPQDDLTAEHPRLRELRLSEKVGAHNQSGDDAPSGIRDDLSR